MHAPITTPAAGDACCPNGANSITDPDCSPTCGNAAIEAGEECDGAALCRANCTLRFHPALIHRYAFDGPATGTGASRALDSIGGRNGTIMGDALNGNGAITLAGGDSGGFIDLPDRLVSVLTNVTVEAWVNWRGGARNQAIFDFGMNSAGAGSSSGTGTTFFFASPSGLDGKLSAVLNVTPVADDIDGSYRFEAGSALPADSVRHVAVTFSDPGAGARKTLKLYRDGSLVGGTNDNVPARANGADNRLSNVDDRNVWIGRANYPVERFAGTLYELRVYSQALTAAEISRSFAAGRDPAP
jgi:hypothetical protein